MNSWSVTRFGKRLTFSQIVPIYYFRCRRDIREIINVIWILEILFWELWYAKKDNCMIIGNLEPSGVSLAIAHFRLLIEDAAVIRGE